MTFLITEIQLASVVLMALVTSLLAFTLPRLGSELKLYKQARRFLCLGTILVTIHFMIQYYLHKSGLVTGELRTCINLMFGIPLSYFFNLSLLHLQRKGDTRWKEHLHILICFAISVVLYQGVYLRHGYSLPHLHLANVLSAVLYAYTLLYADYLLFREYHLILERLKHTPDERSHTLIVWTRHAMYCIVGIGLGFPLMTFVQNEGLRSIYGIISIAVAHFYVFSFIAYHLNRRQAIAMKEEIDQAHALAQQMAQQLKLKEEELAQLSAAQRPRLTNDELDAIKEGTTDTKLNQIASAIRKAEEDRLYTQPGLTLKELSLQLDIPTNLLTGYFQQTPYGKFNQWLMLLRLEEAKRLLLTHPDWSNDIVAQRCGYSSRSYFQRQFLEQTGLTPVLWQKSMLKEMKRPS